MSWWKYAGGLSPGPAAIPNPANPSGWQRLCYERGQPVEVITGGGPGGDRVTS